MHVEVDMIDFVDYDIMYNGMSSDMGKQKKKYFSRHKQKIEILFEQMVTFMANV